jgi:hypothetical protein
VHNYVARQEGRKEGRMEGWDRRVVTIARTNWMGTKYGINKEKW